MASSKKKKGGLLGGLFKSSSKKPKKLTEEEIRDKELVEEFYEKGLDLKELEKYDRDAVGADDVLREDGNFGDIKGSAYVISLKPFYECIGTRKGRLAEGLTDLCFKVLGERVGKKGTYSQQSSDIFIFQFKDGVTPENWRTAIEIINEVGTTFLGNNYNPKEIVADALGHGSAEDILSKKDGGAGLEAALKSVTMDANGQIKFAGSSLAGSSNTVKLKPKAGEWKKKDWEEFSSGIGPREAEMIRVGKDQDMTPEEWKKQKYKGLDLKNAQMRAAGEFRPKSLWVDRNGERRRKKISIQIQNRRRKESGRRVVDVKDAVIW
ncbi:MAG: hypothetical protein OQJ97_07340 [Rhodospirillales bacterium]|nr:hypothetical protein [Rhodospirillales bacterium]